MIEFAAGLILTTKLLPQQRLVNRVQHQDLASCSCVIYPKPVMDVLPHVCLGATNIVGKVRMRPKWGEAGEGERPIFIW